MITQVKRGETIVIDGMKLTYIDNGFYQISRAAAVKLALAVPNCKTVLPKFGYERKVKLGGQDYWLARTQDQGKTVWSVRLV